MNSSRVNLIAGAGVGALLAYLLLGFFAERIYHGGGHGHDEVLAWALATEESAEPAPAPEADVDLAALVAAADPGAGASVFSKCRACHKVEDGANGVGPHLYGVVGRGIGAVAGYSYSDTLAGHGGSWDLAALNGFLENPRGWAPGTKMAFAGVPSPEDRVNLIVWLNSQGPAPIELAAAAAEAATDAPAEPAPADAPAAEAPASEAPAAEAPAGEAPAAEVAAAAAVEPAPAAETPAPAAAPAPAAETPASAEPAPAPAAPAVAAADPAAPAEPAEAPAPVEAAGGGAYAALLAAADPAKGEAVFRRCRACHKVEPGANGVGPSLHGVVGRGIGGVDGYAYSPALSGKEGGWTLDNLMAFLEKPRDWAPGTKMAFAGLAKPEDRINVIVWLNQQSDAPVDLAAE